jgi:hypothetical protein
MGFELREVIFLHVIELGDLDDGEIVAQYSALASEPPKLGQRLLTTIPKADWAAPNN